MLDDGGPVRIEDHRVFQRNAKALAESEGDHHNLAQGHTEHVLFLGVIEERLLEGPLLVDELQTCVQLHRFGNEKDLEGIEQTLSQTLLVNEVACLDLGLVIVICPAFFPELLDVSREDLVPRLSLLLALIYKLLFHHLEVLLHIKQLHLP